MKKVDRETAEKDLNVFIEALRVIANKLSKLEDEKESVLQLIESGNITISESGEITYELIDPIKSESNETILSKLIFKPRRVRVDDIEKRMIGKNDIEKTRNMFAFLTAENSGYFSKMDSDDFINISSIAAFFLPR
jgi:hypothetical protein